MKTFRTNKTILTLALAMGATLIPGLSHAADTTAQKDSSYQNSVYAGKLTEVGSSTGSLSPLKGFAKDLPLITVMRQITPNGWVVKKNDNAAHPLDVQMPVSWEGGKNWVDTLNDLAANYKLNILVNWDNKDITLSPARPNIDGIKKVDDQKAVFELEGTTSSDVTVGSSQQNVKSTPVTPVVKESKVAPVPPMITPAVPVAPVKPVITAVAVPTHPIKQVELWNEDPTKSLKENVVAWGKKAGYDVKWTGEDYPVDARSLSGDFDSDTGPIKQLAEDYGPTSKVEKPLTFQFYQNRTLVVENWSFTQGRR